MGAMTLDVLKQRVRDGRYTPHELRNMLTMFKGYYAKGGKYAEKVEYLEEVMGVEVKNEAHDKKETTDPAVVLNIDEQVARKFLQLKRSADKRSKDWDLTLSDIKKLLQRKTCYYTGVKFTSEGKYARTVDRIDSSKGYVKGNVVACTYWSNQMKNELFELPDPMIKQMKKLISKVEELNE